jgi:hypothetical protein
VGINPRVLPSGKPSQPQSPDYARGCAGPGAGESRRELLRLGLRQSEYLHALWQLRPFSSAGRGSQANVYQTLNPESQKIFDEQQRTKLGLAKTGTQAVGNVQNVLGHPFDPSGVPKVQTGSGIMATRTEA